MLSQQRGPFCASRRAVCAASSTRPPGCSLHLPASSHTLHRRRLADSQLRSRGATSRESRSRRCSCSEGAGRPGAPSTGAQLSARRERHSAAPPPGCTPQRPTPIFLSSTFIASDAPRGYRILYTPLYCVRTWGRRLPPVPLAGLTADVGGSEQSPNDLSGNAMPLLGPRSAAQDGSQPAFRPHAPALHLLHVAPQRVHRRRCSALPSQRHRGARGTNKGA